jgi:hypothetical protein
MPHDEREQVMTESVRRTKRRYAHELYPNPTDEYEIRPLAIEVPCLYARAIGFEIHGTSWSTVEPRSIGGDRVMHMIIARQFAFLADAIHQGLTGDEAWAWADERTSDETGEWVGERAEFYGVPYGDIKPYPCGPERDKHDHYGPPDRRGFRAVTRIVGPESGCLECTEPKEAR